MDFPSKAQLYKGFKTAFVYKEVVLPDECPDALHCALASKWKAFNYAEYLRIVLSRAVAALEGTSFSVPLEESVREFVIRFPPPWNCESEREEERVCEYLMEEI